MARRFFTAERSDHTLQATALVHEAFVRLRSQKDVRWNNDLHFRAVAATMMRRILVDHARARMTEKRGGALDRTTLADSLAVTRRPVIDLLALDEAASKLSAIDPQAVRIIDLRFFGDLTESEVAEVLGISERKVRKDWAWARAWLRRELVESQETQ
jgi:RNA polymerase sigma factor (TIGR02999 family)